MSNARNEFVMSLEQECMTSAPRSPESFGDAIGRFLTVISTQAPSLPGMHGIFNGYGRIYLDCGHIELAACECCSPYLLPSVMERQETLVAQALEQMAREGFGLLLANNNHSGLLQSECPIWGCHENHMTEEHPVKFGDRILPFLVTRIYAGAGGIHYPSGDFLAAVRPIRIELDVGGGTTEHRAIHSTARDEHLMGPSRNRYRYHLILGDGHRSHFNLALQFGATALALKAVFFDSKLPEKLASLRGLPLQGSWVRTLRQLNVLARPGHPPKVDPIVLDVQRIYLEAARRYAGSLDEQPEWIPRLLADWDDVLTAMEKPDRAWLAARLDAFAKYEFYSAVLQQNHRDWSDLPRHGQLFHELALLDHSYHEFANSASTFSQLQRAGAMKHRVSSPLAPGSESEPYVPETKTRAATRARFIRENAGRRHLLVDWAWVHDHQSGQTCHIHDPFAQSFSDWGSFEIDPSLAFLERNRELYRILGRERSPL